MQHKLPIRFEYKPEETHRGKIILQWKTLQLLPKGY